MPCAEIRNLSKGRSQSPARRGRNANQAPVRLGEVGALACSFPTRQIRVRRIEGLPLPGKLFAAVHLGDQPSGSALFLHRAGNRLHRMLHAASVRSSRLGCQPNSRAPCNHDPRIILLDCAEKALDLPAEALIKKVIGPAAVRPPVTVNVDGAFGRRSLTDRLYIIATSRAFQPIVPDFRNASASFLALSIALLASEVEDDH